MATGQTGNDIFNSTPINPGLDDPEQLTGESIQSFVTFVVQPQWLVALGILVTHAQVTTLSKLKLTQKNLINYGGIILISRPTFMDISISSKYMGYLQHLIQVSIIYTHKNTDYIYLYILLCMSAQEHVTSSTRGE